MDVAVPGPVVQISAAIDGEAPIMVARLLHSLDDAAKLVVADVEVIDLLVLFECPSLIAAHHSLFLLVFSIVDR